MTHEAEAVRLLLLELASGCETADDVAAKLRVVGIRGHRRACRSCAVARWLRMHGLYWDIGGLSDPTACARRFDYKTNKYTFVDVPNVVVKFARGFDRGAYPDLEAA